MKKISVILGAALCLLAVSCGKPSEAGENEVLWYDAPAGVWLEALPLGNSNMGAMVYGGVQKEEIQLNEETFWSGGPYNNNSPRSLARLDEVRQLIFDGKEAEAKTIIDQDFVVGPHGMRFLNAGSLFIEYEGVGEAEDYHRQLDLSNAVNTTSYSSNGVNYTRTAFASMPEKVVVVRLTEDKKTSFSLSYNARLPFEAKAEGKDLVAVVQGDSMEGIDAKLAAEIVIRVLSDGTVSAAGDKIQVSGATATTLLISAATNFVNYHDVSGDASAKNAARLAAAEKLSYKELLKRHIAAYRDQYDRVDLTLPAGANASLPTNQRLDSFTGSDDMGMVELMFNYGRYLLISSSQPGGQAANLQGVWNQEHMAPWDSKYTININAEMNYWPAEVCGLTETTEPLFSMIRDLSETGAVTAREMYGCGGWMAHHNTDIWRIAGPVDAADWGMYPNGGAWLATHLWEHFLFTRDKEFLKEWYPVIKGAADFYLDYMQVDPNNGYLVVVPSVSPEHGGVGKANPLTAGCTMDTQIVVDIMTAARTAAAELGIDEEYRKTLAETMAKLPPMKVGQYGQLQEWIEDMDDPKDEHRHISHLYGLYPSNQINPGTPELFDAARVTLIQRGDQATGWSLGWKTNFWARMLDGNHAFLILSNTSTHDVTMLQEPEFEPRAVVDNTEYEAAHRVRTNGKDGRLELKTALQMEHYQSDMAAMIQLGKWFDFLRENGVWNNTRIIVVSDHGYDLGLNHILTGGAEGENALAPHEGIMAYNALMMIKDFGSGEEFRTDSTFMTIADTPSEAMRGLIENPVNPFTGKPINEAAKNGGEQYVMITDWRIAENHGTQYTDPVRLTLRNENVLDEKNWVLP